MDCRSLRVKRERSQGQAEDLELMPLAKKLTGLRLTQVPSEEKIFGGVNQNNVDFMAIGQSSGVGAGTAYGQCDGDNKENNFGHQIQTSNGIDMRDEDVDMISSSQEEEIINGRGQDQVASTLIQDGFERSVINSLMAEAENQFCLGEPRVCQTSTLPHYEYPVIYEPTLNELENPAYYEQNRQLFYLYLERVHRYNMSPHSYVIRMRRER